MKKLIILTLFFAFSLSTQAQILTYSAAWETADNQKRLEIATYSVAVKILDTPSDSIYAPKAAAILLSNIMDHSNRRYTRAAIDRQVNPERLTDAQLITGIRGILIAEHWAEQLRSGAITATEYYEATQ